jgi:hypothetical protein
MTTKTPSVGQLLRADMDAALARAARDLGTPLEWSEIERHTLALAATAADRYEELRRLWVAELNRPEPRATSAANLAGELRLTEKAVVDLLMRVNLGTGPAKSERHQRAARSRWNPVQAHG